MGNYDDIINMEHHVSNKHPRMPMSKRAAQFAPFAAIDGHSEALSEAEAQWNTEDADDSFDPLIE